MIKELSMAENEDFYRDLLENLSDGVYFTDSEGRITYWNKSAERLTGFSKEEVLGRRCRDNILVHVDEAGLCLCLTGCPLAMTMADRQPREQEVFLRTKEGHRLPVLVKAAPIMGPSGEIKGAVEIFSSNSAKALILERLAEMERNALVDALTGLGNRRYIEMQLRSRLEEFRRNQWLFGVLFIDVDHFKKINDRFGHEVGDKVLRMVGQTLQMSSRYADAVGRWGGEEFLAIISNVKVVRLAEVAERFRVLIERSGFELGEHIGVTVSIGAAEILEEDDAESLVNRADRNLYLAKQSGRNRVCS
jgi:diguanylate cyclase (GGDEF)-like protein/PAS domain S-box-containing protein